MIIEKIMLKNETGLHARPATELAKTAMKYKSNITLSANGKTVNAKQPLMIMSAGIKNKTEIEIVCDGEDEQEAINEIKSAFENNFGE